MSNNFKSSCTLLSKVVTTYTTLITLQLCKVAKVVQSSIGRFADVSEDQFLLAEIKFILTDLSRVSDQLTY